MNEERIVEVARQLATLNSKLSNRIGEMLPEKDMLSFLDDVHDIGDQWSNLMQDMLEAIEEGKLPDNIHWFSSKALGHSVSHSDECKEWEKRRREQYEICRKQKNSEEACREAKKRQFNVFADVKLETIDKRVAKMERQLKKLIDEK